MLGGRGNKRPYGYTTIVVLTAKLQNIMETDTIIIEDAISALRSCDKVRIIAVGGGRDIDVVIKSPIACRCVRLALQDYKQNHLKNERIYRQRVGQNH